MNRTDRARRSGRRAALLGVGLSFLLHAAVLALVRFDVPALPGRARVVFERDESVPLAIARAVEVVALRPEPRALARGTVTGAGAAAAASPAAGGITAPAPAPLAGAPLLPAATAGGPGYDRLVILDPLLHVAAVPVSVTDLPAAEPAREEGVAPDAAVYEPGSIGKAKRQWASAGAGETDQGDGRTWSFVGIGGGGHCPMPGRGGARPDPFWRTIL